MKNTFAIASLAGAILLQHQVALSETKFFKSSDTIEVVTTDYAGTPCLLYEDAQKKQKLELCTCNCAISRRRGGIHHHIWKHAKFRLSPTLNSASLCIFCDGQIIKFPMPVFVNGGPVFPPSTQYIGPCPHQHRNAITFNEFEFKDLSKEEPSLEISFQSFTGELVRKQFVGKDSIGELFNRLNGILNEMKVDTVPQYVNVFGDGDLLVTKSDIIELKTKVKALISTFNLKTINASTTNNPAPESTNPFEKKGAQGTATFDYSKNGGVISIQNGGDIFKTKWSRYSSSRVYAHADFSKAIGGRPQFTVFPPSPTLAKTLQYSSSPRNVAVGEVVVFQNKAGKLLAVKIVEVKDKQSGASENSLTIQWKAL